MIIGSRNIALTFHGILGYSALGAMLIETVLVWKARFKGSTAVSPKLAFVYPIRLLLVGSRLFRGRYCRTAFGPVKLNGF